MHSWQAKVTPCGSSTWYIYTVYVHGKHLWQKITDCHGLSKQLSPLPKIWALIIISSKTCIAIINVYSCSVCHSDLPPFRVEQSQWLHDIYPQRMDSITNTCKCRLCMCAYVLLQWAYLSEKPSLCRIFICFISVLFPDSPAPGDRNDQDSNWHTTVHMLQVF